MNKKGFSNSTLDTGAIEEIRHKIAQTNATTVTLEQKLENLSSRLLQTGEQIPAHGQSGLSETQKEYLKTASELTIVREKKLLLQANLEVQCI